MKAAPGIGGSGNKTKGERDEDCIIDIRSTFGRVY